MQYKYKNLAFILMIVLMAYSSVQIAETFAVKAFAPQKGSQTVVDKANVLTQMKSLQDSITSLRQQLAVNPSDLSLKQSLDSAMSQYEALKFSLGGDEPVPTGGRLPSRAIAKSGKDTIPYNIVPAGCGTTTTTFTNNTPVTIPTGPGVVTSTITVSGANPYLFDVDLQTFIRHTFNADLDITLTSPAGTVVTITTDNGAGNDDVFNGTVFDDDANPGGQVPYTTNNGVVTDHAYVNLTTATPLTPEEPLGAFIGENPNGTWTLTISDDLAGDGGSLDSWNLNISTRPTAPATTMSTFTNNTPVTIPTGPGVVTQTINVSGAGTFIGDVNLQTFITHTFNADLDITLTSPAGTVVTITTDNAAGNDNVFNGTLFDDDANPAGQVPYVNNNTVTSGPGVTTDQLYANLVTVNNLTPEEPLAAFIGENPNGIWTLTISDDLAGDGGSLNMFSLQITTFTCAQAPSIQFSAANYSISEDGGSATITVTRTGDTSGTSMVNYATSNGTATSPSDYTTTSGVLTFAPTVTSQTFMVPIINDNLTEPDETVNLTLSNPVNAVLGSPSAAVLTITNDDRLDHTTVYAVDSSNNRIQRSTSNGMTWTLVGLGAGTGLGQFNNPQGVSSSLNDMILFVADTGNNRIQRSTNGGASWQLIAGPGVGIGQVNAPQGVAYDERNDRLYVADTANSRIQVVTGASTASPIPALFANSVAGTGLGQFNLPQGIAVDGNGLVYVADTGNSRIQVNMTGMMSGWQVFANATAGNTVGKMNQPRGLYVNGAGDVYVADTLNNRIQKFSVGLWSVFMAPGVTLGTVNAPEGIVTTSTNFAFVGDTVNNRVQRLTTTGTSPTLVGAPGVSTGQFNQVSNMR